MTVISILYLVSLYGIQAVLLGPIIMSDGSGDMEIPWNMFPVAVVLNLILAVVTIAVLVKNVKRVRGNISLQKQLNYLALAMKVLTVPFFITHLQLWMLVSAAFLVDRYYCSLGSLVWPLPGLWCWSPRLTPSAGCMSSGETTPCPMENSSGT